MILPIDSLHQGHWFKLICGASFHHLPSIRNLALIYTLAGADCIDLAADPAIVRAAQAGIEVAQRVDPTCSPPLLMASFNDGEDPHFRKAQVIDSSCPSSCPQPCLAVCPPHAILTNSQPAGIQIQADLCYGCGRCEPICPHHRIETVGYQPAAAQILPLLIQSGVEAVEIHTQVGRLAAFRQIWDDLQPYLIQLKVISISFGNGLGLEDYLHRLAQLLEPWWRRSPLGSAIGGTVIWQTDGRPMSGDIGPGTTKATLKVADQVLAMQLPGYVQLAGGTNAATVPQIGNRAIAGVAYGSFARQHVATAAEIPHLEQEPDVLKQAVAQAYQLVSQIKSRSPLRV